MGTWRTALDDLVSWLDGNGDLQSAGHGLYRDLDVSAKEDFPKGYVAYGQDSTNTESLVTYSFQVFFVDICDQPADEDDKADVVDRMSEVKNQCFKAYYEGSLFNSQYRVSTTTSPVMYEERKNLLFGWVMNVSVTTPTNLNNCG